MWKKLALVCASAAVFGCSAELGELDENGELIGSESEAIAAGTMHPGERLFMGQKLLSPNCGSRLVMQTDGNLVVYKGSSALWSAGTANRGAYAALQGDGNFVVYNENNASLWSSSTRNEGTSRLAMQNDSNAVIYDILNRPIWSSNTSRSGSSTCGTTAQFTETTVLESHADRPGADLGGMPIRGRDLIACGNACGTNLSCRSFTWVAANQVEPASQCWLKSSAPAPVFTSLNMTSGLKKRVQQGGIVVP